MRLARKTIKRAFNSVGLEVKKIRQEVEVETKDACPAELTREDLDLISYIFEKKLTMVSRERLWNTLMACKYALEQGIEGDFVECGVWRGGNAILAAAIFKRYGANKRVYLFDTFAGMTEPSSKDVGIEDQLPAFEQFATNQRDGHNEWCYASLEDVKSNFRKAGLLSDRVVFIKGDVLDTLSLSDNIPDKISVLRLDTDWYDSTKKELEVLYPRLSLGGIIIMDDYGYWAGVREATDQFFSGKNDRPFLQYVDASCRSGIKAVKEIASRHPVSP